jgi:hypothetical protein
MPQRRSSGGMQHREISRFKNASHNHLATCFDECLYLCIERARREQLSPEYKQRLKNWNGLDSRRVITGPRSAPRHTPCSSIRGLHHQAPRPHRDHAISKSAVKVQTLDTLQGSTNETANRQQTQTKWMEATFYSALLPHARRPSGYSDMARHRPT